MQFGDRHDLSWWRFADFTASQLYEVLRFRQAIFVVEQASPFPDLDGRDQRAAHLLLQVEGALAGYLRLLPEGDGSVAIGRVAVAAQLRGNGLARLLMSEALARCACDHSQSRLLLSAQTHLVPFYASLGFRAISPPSRDYGISHVEMVRPCPD